MLAGEILRLGARRHPRKTALICGARRLSYGALDALANRIANALLARGIAKGQTVAAMSRNLPDYVALHFASARIGSLLVNMMPAYAPDEIAAILNHTGARLILVEAEFQDRVAAVRDRCPNLRDVVTLGEAGIAGAVPLEKFVAGAADSHPGIALSVDDPYAMTFTGGTTGRPKGALVSHRARFVSSWTTALEHEVSSADTVGVLTPLYHAMGMTIWLQAAMLAGATAVLLTGWDPDRFAEETARHGITNALMVPVQLRELLGEQHFDPCALASLKKLGCGGAITPPDLVAEVNARLPGVLFTNHYGQSETGPLCLFKHHHPRERAGTIGQPAAGVELMVVDPEGNAVAPGAVGEIVTRGPYMMAGYYKDPEETANYFRQGDGWGWTGDLATIDGEGFVTLVGRSKDMIVTGGINVYPREVELVLEKHDAVAECTVFGVPDAKWGEALVAYVVREDGARESEAELVHFCEQHLARFKRPRYVRFVDAIPKTPSGKIQKPKLREAFLRESEVS